MNSSSLYIASAEPYVQDAATEMRNPGRNSRSCSQNATVTNAISDIQLPGGMCFKRIQNGPTATNRWLNRTVLGIGLASLFSDWSHEIATTVMPAFLATMGVAAVWLGLIEGVSDGLSSFAKMASGYYTDKLRRRKPIAVVGYLVTALGTASFGLATAAWHVLMARALRVAGARRADAGAQGAAGRRGDEGNLRARVRLRADDGHAGRDCRPGDGVLPAAACSTIITRRSLR